LFLAMLWRVLAALLFCLPALAAPEARDDNGYAALAAYFDDYITTCAVVPLFLLIPRQQIR
ncbi:MAG: hypothetical protein IIY82_00800, partial [Firmicutes bacterium]|nr:hypothetical protein [Bacillota bacterium]